MAQPAPTSIRLDPVLRKRLDHLLRQRGLSSVIEDGLRELLARTCPTCGSLRPARTWRRYFADAADVAAWARRHHDVAAYVVVDYGRGPAAYKGRIMSVSDGHRIELAPFAPRSGRSRILLAEYVVDAITGVPHNEDDTVFRAEHPGIPVEAWA